MRLSKRKSLGPFPRRGRGTALLIAGALTLTVFPDAFGASRNPDLRRQAATGAGDVISCTGAGDKVSPEELASTGRALLVVGDPERAVLVLRRAVEARPRAGEYRIALARAELARAGVAGKDRKSVV